MTTKNIKMVCATCGSDDVKRDAWATWDTELQVWEIGDLFDHAYCEACDGTCHIEEKEI